MTKTGGTGKNLKSGKGSISVNKNVILLIEDEEKLSRTLAEYLELNGYRVLRALNGLEGLSMFYDHMHEVDLILLDIMLRQGEPEIRLMYALSGEFQKLIQTRLAMKQLKLTRVTPRTFDSLPESLKKEFPDNPLLKLHPFRAFKTCEGAAGFTDAELAGNLEAVRNASRALVSGGGEPRIILEQLVLRLTARR